MNKYIKYKIRLKTISPIHIGSQYKLLKKEYIYDKLQKKIYILDIGKFTKFLDSRNLVDKYMDFMMGNSIKSLDEWLKINKIKLNDIKKSIMYEIDSPNLVGVGERDISMFVKDPYGMPYIPGSTIKGIIRTAILSYEIDRNISNYKKTMDDINKLLYKLDRSNLKKISQKAKEIEDNVLSYEVFDNNKKIKLSKLSNIIVSDSEPIDVKNIVLCQKIDYFLTEYCNKKSNELTVFKESIKPGIDIDFTLSIENKDNCYDIEYILNALKEFFDIQNEYYLDNFYLIKNQEYKREKCYCYVGGNIGFNNKSLMLSLFGYESVNNISLILDSMFKKHKHRFDNDLGYSPRALKCTKLNGKIYPMGLCELTLI